MTSRLLGVLALVFALTPLAAHAQPHPSKGGGFRFLNATPADLEGVEPTSANPFTAFLPAGATPDYAYWTARMSLDAITRASTRATRGLRAAPDATYQERERGRLMPNDTVAERIAGFGPASDSPGVEVTGTFEQLTQPALTRTTVRSEDMTTQFVPHSISTYAFAGQYRGAEVSGAQIGDGPFGTSTGDVDVYVIEVTSPNTYLTISVHTPLGSLDPVMALFDMNDQFIFKQDDSKLATGQTSEDPIGSVLLENPGRYVLFVWGYTPDVRGLPLTNWIDPASGVGVGSTGPYQLQIAASQPDTDSYSVDLEAGDVLAVASPSASLWDVSIIDPTGVVRMGSRQDLSAYYAEDGPLASPAELGNFERGRSAAIVAPVTGTYTIAARGQGPYRMYVQAAEPGHARPGAPQTQRIFVDFDGHTVNAALEYGGGPSAATLSPMSAFMARWGLDASDQSEVIDGVLAALQRTLQDELRHVPGMSGLTIELLNSRDHADPGDTMNRLVIGGTIEQLGIETIGIASTVDIGNYRSNDVAVILLDLLSTPADNPNSLNQYGLGIGISKTDLVGHSVGIIASHEAAHFFGMHHTDNRNEVNNISDEGGRLTSSLGIGVDNVFGSLDDRTARYRDDTFSAYGTMHGTQATPIALARSLHAMSQAVASASGNATVLGRSRGGTDGTVSVGAVRGGAPAAQGYTYDFGSISVRLTGLEGQESLWILEPGSELWRRAEPGEVSALLRTLTRPRAVTMEAPASASEAVDAMNALRAVANRE